MEKKQTSNGNQIKTLNVNHFSFSFSLVTSSIYRAFTHVYLLYIRTYSSFSSSRVPLNVGHLMWSRTVTYWFLCKLNKVRISLKRKYVINIWQFFYCSLILKTPDVFARVLISKLKNEQLKEAFKSFRPYEHRITASALYPGK